MSNIADKEHTPAGIQRQVNATVRPHNALRTQVQGGKVGRRHWSEASIEHVRAQAEPLIKRLVEIAFNDNHPGQMAAHKLLIDRYMPAVKAIEVGGLGGKAIEVKVSVEGIEAFSSMKTIEGTSEEVG